jgi:hypothetical protein
MRELKIYHLSLTLIDTEEGHLLIENFVNIFFVTSLPENLMSNGSSRHDDAAQTK